MKLTSKSISQNLCRSILVAAVATLAVGCGSSSDDVGVENPDNTGSEGGETTEPLVSNSDEYSKNSEWSDNKWISVNSNATSSYTQGIQRIIYCLGSHPNDQTIGVFADGIFGPNTKAAIEDFQGNRAIAIDGIVGDETWDALQAVVELDIEVDAGNGYNAHSIDGASCGTEVQFYQNQTGDGDWKMAETPSSTKMVQFSISAPNQE